MVKANSRIFGLDIMRSIAIILVVFVHGRDILKLHFIIPSLPLPDGVDLFFVLSGFLIGGILIRNIDKNQGLSFKNLKTFLKRRWFRTLPNYYLFLGINCLLIYLHLLPGTLNKYLITYFGFMQNFFKPYDFLFWESWSLSVEEWFYLSFPLLLFIGMYFFKNRPKKVILSVISLFLLLPLIYRLYSAGLDRDFDLYVRKLVLARLDIIGYGLLGAFLHHYYKDQWFRYKNLLFILGISSLLLLSSSWLDITSFRATYYYCFIGLSILLLFPKLSSLKNENIPFQPFFFISKISYSMYLINIPVFFILTRFYQPSSALETIIAYLLFWVLTIILSFLNYKYFEKPVMDLRDR